MTCYKENFGEDIDGNRGQSMWFYDLDEDDTDDILDYIEENTELMDTPRNEWPKTITVTLLSRYTDEWVDFEIDPRKYIKE